MAFLIYGSFSHETRKLLLCIYNISLPPLCLSVCRVWTLVLRLLFSYIDSFIFVHILWQMQKSSMHFVVKFLSSWPLHAIYLCICVCILKSCMRVSIFTRLWSLQTKLTFFPSHFWEDAVKFSVLVSIVNRNARYHYPFGFIKSRVIGRFLDVTRRILAIYIIQLN